MLPTGGIDAVTGDGRSVAGVASRRAMKREEADVNSKLLAGAVVVAAATLAVYPSAVPAAPARHISCSLRTTTLIEPGNTTVDPTATKGHDFSYETCGQPLGRGVHVSSFSVAPQSSTTGTVTGHWESFFSTGTYHGTERVSVTVTSSTQVTYSGTATITGGTGTLSHAAGAVKLRCSSNDAGIHVLCHLKVALR
jgi:hypothetical protein